MLSRLSNTVRLLLGNTLLYDTVSHSRHELLQSFSLHLFCKRVIEPIITLADFRKSIARRIVLAALQIRLNVNGRGDNPPFSFVEFNQLDSAREGCAICSLDMMSDPSRWDEAIGKVLSEIRTLGTYGLSEGEMERYAGSLMTDAEQLAAMGENISHGDQLSYLMETVACGHTFMSPDQSYEATEAALRTLTLEEVNNEAAELCSHVTSLNGESLAADGPVIAIACCPKLPSEKTEGHYCDEEKLVRSISAAANLPITPNKDVLVPRTLLSDEDIAAAVAAQPPAWTQGVFTDGTSPTPADQVTSPFTLRRLSNGLRIGVAASPAESQRGHLRLVAPGGRDREAALGLKKGSMVIGARTMQEGGAFGQWTREQVELFCVDHLIMVEINCNEEFLIFDFVFPTNEVGNVGFGENIKMGITGTEAVLQILREIIVGFKWEEDALWRSKQNFYATHDGLSKNLEGMTTEKLMEKMTQNDSRFLSVDHETIDAITLEDAKTAVMSQLIPSELEISMVGDFLDVGEILEMVKLFIGTISPDQNKNYLPTVPVPAENVNRVSPLPHIASHLDFELPDSDPRAVAYVSGGTPNRWGILSDGSTVAQRVVAANLGGSDYDKARRQHPLYACVALSLISEIINRRLFSYVRERKQLTYDANFHFTSFERLAGGYFLVTVTASKDKAQAALEACKETLRQVRSTSPITSDNLESAKRVVINRHEGEMRTSRYLAELLSGIQLESIPYKGPSSITDFNGMVQSMTVKDLQFVLGCIDLDEESLFTAIGQTVQPEGLALTDSEEVVPSVAVMPGRRGGPLMG
uniref:Peptidase M16 C-terminal domain-containing protein n=1 Tax=Corethron hystrix TaxID=216773 RepID=A0A7S1BTA2_9STRA|mmetsp:Transcript_38699/g.89932  ORF Transcript_38699/g.89932 Transcript_38699/m.89932 type:complete len:810 (+) Transcript_38699:2386-4815(+)|eukprot:CAMPEP_0113318214 /NCGR_PEP_ID=MMETSP0010_2-20120614/12855_1 /TAXON_ID=216773 ORGANISM="Corethron hystrix, Strain 308" /NCGR_SAMPLE_ID=MMETSP0010_2 /ASSEMBLY_ACC=CAM_ASM_000155 /LENGTH=809 /DNA_ID=CAMNT_0000175437 /DNA_START=2250 /DNA_END=4679 /DNA_ORIENTATION=+ /assembly_acc=CAM_ASM_000155